jgi:hypothetical protein
MPGFAIAGTGTENRAGFTGEVIGINGNGDGGSQSALNGAFSASGLPINTLDITSDGAHVSDPGCNCATPVNPNTDMIQEFKVLTSNFSAENAKGPAVISSVSKSGSRNFHGEGYFYARDYSMNANDWVNNELGIKKPQNKYFFPGGNLGGPVLIPGTNFNKKRDKLFFFTGYEYYYQTLDTGVISATVPTPGMLTGNFSPAELSKLGNVDSTGGPPAQVNTSLYPGGIIPASSIDKGGLALLNLYPKVNANPNATGGFNYVDDVAFNQNSWQWLTRGDYNISDNTKLFVRYNLQKEQQQFPVGLWWRNGGQVPYPTPILGKNQSQSVSASLTHVFSPSLTNEFVFSYTYIDFPNVFQDPTKVDRTAIGYNYQGIYKNGVKQIPALTSWGSGELATLFNPGGFEAGGSKGLFADKYLPTLSDTVSKVWGTHTMKFGAFYEFVINDQPANGYTNGQIAENSSWGANTTGNTYADLLTGVVASYSEQNKNPLHNEAYNTFELFAQDNWKVSKRLTLELGLRASHLGSWYDRQGFGFAVWNPATYSPTAAATTYPGFQWNKQNSSVPLSGFPNRAMVWAPRFGMAYDIFGTGNTVLRGGWGLYYYHNAQFTTGLDAPAGVQVVGASGTTLAQIDQIQPGTQAISTAGVDPHDNAVPKTYSYSFTISQRVPGTASLLEIAYVGNQSSNLLNTGNNGTNVNPIPAGTFINYPTDPSSLDTGGPIYNGYRKFPTYTDLYIVNHNLYSNYNAFQTTWVRQKGRYDVQVNYTYGKALGIVGSDQLNLKNDYGPAAFDRRHVFNAAYSVELPNPIEANSNAAAKALVNGWQFSGITQFQAGVNLTAGAPTANGGSIFNLNANGATLANGYNINALNINGTNNIPLQPILTCNPTSNLGPNQYVNPSCYSLPTRPGQNGPTVGPEVFGPAFFNSDLSLFKNFRFGETKKLQFRFSAYNFLNHPLNSFRSGSSNLNLTYNPMTGTLGSFQQTPNGQPVNIFGTTTEKQGHRIIQLALKFYF